ncbi:glycosyltransferase [Fluviicola sp.]|uniref:glycosyltransferase n=1 Tax=Fluviicola sp. TaxID=1917219 RepID=UPI002638E753|nr:glycosyltransferase [Fluviicola sp.]
MKNKLLIVVGVQTYPNPALSKIHSDLNELFDIDIFGLDKQNALNTFPNYKSYSFLSRSYNKLRLYKLLHLIFFFLTKNQRDLLNFKLQLRLKRAGFFFLKKQQYDFILNIDSTGAYIAKSKNRKIHNALFIYEILGFQNYSDGKKMVDFLCHMEKKAIQNTSFLISSANDELGKLLNEIHNTNKEIISYSICPPQQFKEEITLNSLLKFYYHGALFENRGLEAAILAIKDLPNAELHIRGFGPLKETLIHLIQKHEISNVFLLEPVEMSKLTEEAIHFDLGVSLVRMNVLNHQYNVGFKTFENISAGLALIVPESKPLKKLIDHASNGIYYTDATIPELSKVFTFCVENPEQIKTWKENSRKVYQELYNPSFQQRTLISSIHKFFNHQ